MKQARDPQLAATVGESFRRMRGGMTQQQFADRLGVSRVLLAQTETGRMIPGVSILMRAADISGETVDSILGRRPRSATETLQHLRARILAALDSPVAAPGGET